MITVEGSEAGISTSPEKKLAELAPINNPTRGAHVSILWEALKGVAGCRLSPEAGLVVVEISKRIEEVQKS